eukprot:14541861-Alexandrium_andersonii.AAC.1
MVLGWSRARLQEWASGRGVASAKLLRTWHHAVLARARRVESAVGDRLRALEAVPVEVLRAECEKAGVGESCGLLRLWCGTHGISLHLEVEF